jgi:YD repeat-containing protein
MSSRTFLKVALVIAVLFLGIRAKAQTYCLTPTAVPQPPPPPSPPPACQPKECDKCTKSPCYIATGIYGRDDVDLTLPTAGTFSLIASRLYDSSRLTDGPLGTGWFLSLTAQLYYATYLVTAPNTYSHEADIIMPDGVLYRFTIGSTGAFTAPFGRFDTLIRNADGTYALTLQQSRTVYRFSADGSIASLTDEYGNVINWTYDGAGHVQRLADSAGSGRYIDVTWGADGRIASLTDNSGRQVKYYYNPANGTLSGVADPIVSGDSSLRSATYSYAQGRFGTLLTRIADRWNRVVSALEWYPDGKLKSYTDGFYDAANPSACTGEKYSYTYQPSTPATGGLTTKSNSLGAAVSYRYDSIGLVNASGFDYVNGLPARGGYNNLSSYEYDAAGRITKVTSPSPEPYPGSGIVVWTYTYDLIDHSEGTVGQSQDELGGLEV